MKSDARESTNSRRVIKGAVDTREEETNPFTPLPGLSTLETNKVDTGNHIDTPQRVNQGFHEAEQSAPTGKLKCSLEERERERELKLSRLEGISGIGSR